MTEEWDDDEFGTFESADAGSSNVSESSRTVAQNNPPAWILEAQSPKIVETPSVDISGEKYSGVFAGMSENLVSHSSNINTEGSGMLKDQNLGAASLENISTSKYKALESGDSNSVGFDLPGKFPPIINPASEVGDHRTPSADPASKKKEDDLETKRESRIVLELQSKLDAAIMMKGQTEKYLSELRNELNEMTRRMKMENEEMKKSRREEIARIAKEHHAEVEELKEESQKMIQLMTRQFSDATRQALVEQALDSDKNLESVVQKCLTLMDRQESVLQQKIKDDAEISESKIKSLTENCEVKLKDFVDAECAKTSEKCSQISEDAKSTIKAQIDELLKTQMELSADSNREAMNDLTKTFETRLELAFKQERSKSCDAMKESVEASRKSILDSVANEERKNQKQREQNILALQMLLTASQEHLKELSSQNKSS